MALNNLQYDWRVERVADIRLLSQIWCTNSLNRRWRYQMMNLLFERDCAFELGSKDVLSKSSNCFEGLYCRLSLRYFGRDGSNFDSLHVLKWRWWNEKLTWFHLFDASNQISKSCGGLQFLLGSQPYSEVLCKTFRSNHSDDKSSLSKRIR